MLVTDVRPDRHVPEVAVAPWKTRPPAAVRFSAPAVRRAQAATVIRRRRVMLILVGSAALAAAAGGATGATAAWIVAAVALVLAVVYQSLAAHMHHHAAEREIARAFGAGPSLDDAAWARLAPELGLASSGNDDIPGPTGESTAVALYAASLLLAWILTPVVGAIRLVRGNVTEQDEGLLGMVVRAQQYGRSQSLRVLSMSVVATAGVAGVGMTAPSGANASPSTATAVPASAVHAAATSQSPATAVRSSSTSSYTVRPGNTLTEIASQYRTTVSALAALNDLSDPNLILIGQVLQVPVPTYTVQPGDTLTSIGSRFGLSTTKLAAANRISDPDLILVGQVLHVHGGDLPAVTSPAPAPSSTVAVSTASSHPTAATQTAAATKHAASGPTVTQRAAPLVGSGTYTVQTGDTLFAVAAKFDTTVATLVEANQLSDNTILAGQVLQVGGQGANATRAAAKPARPAAKPIRAAAKPTRAAAKPTRAAAKPTRAASKPVHTTAKPTRSAAKPTRTTRTTSAPTPTTAKAPTTPARSTATTHTAAKAPTTTPRRAPATTSTTTTAPTTTSTPPASSSSPSAGSPDTNQSASSLEACVIRVESGGNPQAMSANGEYWGLFQFSKPTWVAYGGEASAWGSASASVQEQVFHTAIADGGASNWTLYDGC